MQGYVLKAEHSSFSKDIQPCPRLARIVLSLSRHKELVLIFSRRPGLDNIDRFRLKNLISEQYGYAWPGFRYLVIILLIPELFTKQRKAWLRFALQRGNIPCMCGAYGVQLHDMTQLYTIARVQSGHG